jgi:hypothetical protein
MYTSDVIEIDNSNILSYMKVSYNGISFNSDMKYLTRVKNKYLNSGTITQNDVTILINCFGKTGIEKYFSVYLEKDQLNNLMEHLNKNKG